MLKVFGEIIDKIVDGFLMGIGFILSITFVLFIIYMISGINIINYIS